MRLIYFSIFTFFISSFDLVGATFKITYYSDKKILDMPEKYEKETTLIIENKMFSTLVAQVIDSDDHLVSILNIPLISAKI